MKNERQRSRSDQSPRMLLKGGPVRRILLTVLMVWGLVLNGCRTADPPAPQVRKEPAKVIKYHLGQSVENRPIYAISIGEGPSVLLYIASIHGDENVGTPMLERLSVYLRQHPELVGDHRVILIPMINPDGVVRGWRYNARGIDLNRNFAAFNRINNHRNGLSPFSEPEAEIIRDIIDTFHPKRILVLHQPLGCIDYDGPGRGLAEHLSRYSQLEVCKLGARPGSLGSYAGETLRIPTITFELPADVHGLHPDVVWSIYKRSLVAFLTYSEDRFLQLTAE